MKIIYFVYSGDPEVDNKIAPLLFGKNSISDQLEKALNQQYGEELSVILIRYYIDGKIAKFPIPKRQLSNFNKKEKGIICNFNINGNSLLKQNDNDLKSFIKSSTIKGINIVKAKLSSKKFNFDFDSLIKDIEKLFQNYKSFILDDFILN